MMKLRFSSLFGLSSMALSLTLSGRLANINQFRANVKRKGEQQFIDLLRDMARKKSWQDLLENEVFLRQLEVDTEKSRRAFISDPSVDATVRAWSSPFQGNAADVLLMTISDYLDKQRVVYARHTSIVNSSGTGKSRTVDQVARKIITVPMCLREDGSQARDPNDQAAVAQRLHGLVYSLLTVMHNYLVAIESEWHVANGVADIPALPTLTDDDINNLSQAEWYEQALLVKARQEKLAIAFRECITAGQSFQTPNSYRQTFFEEVIDRANEHTGTGFKRAKPSRIQTWRRGVTEAGIKLSRFHLFSPEIRSNPSRRVANRDLPLLHPISELSFDDLAYSAKEYAITLYQMVQMDWISHLGRPFSILRMEMLAVWPADRLSAICDCVAATTGFETLVTVAGSEPLLAEAAHELIDRTKVNPVRHLANNSDLNCVDRGRRGELVAALLIMRARDESSDTRKWVSVIDFMKAPLPAPRYEMLKNAPPPHWRPGGSKRFEVSFKTVTDGDMINIHSLWKFITRGAMIMCADNQRGVDIVLPICDPRKTLSRRNVTAILIQVKNDKAFQDRIDKTLFDGMDPFRIGLFSDGDFPLPVIRMVFALASHQPGVLFPAVPERRNHDGRFTAYDIWCAGLSPETFKDIGGDLTSYQALLQRSLQPHDVYDLKETKDQYLDESTRNARGSLRRRMEPLADTRDEHNYNHMMLTLSLTVPLAHSDENLAFRDSHDEQIFALPPWVIKCIVSPQNLTASNSLHDNLYSLICGASQSLQLERVRGTIPRLGPYSAVEQRHGMYGTVSLQPPPSIYVTDTPVVMSLLPHAHPIIKYKPLKWNEVARISTNESCLCITIRLSEVASNLMTLSELQAGRDPDHRQRPLEIRLLPDIVCVDCASRPSVKRGQIHSTFRLAPAECLLALPQRRRSARCGNNKQAEALLR
ncbi:hypothetical protein BJV78DRAFT_1354923 [Lactifluus subvellereus]|nr:hypothetical protein BJV78DRAFT_1354923 [Lactifluus subvellereus]